MAAPAAPSEILDVNRRYHDVAARDYDSKWGISFGEIGRHQVLGKARKLLGERPGPYARALEIGAGTGYFSLNLLRAGVVAHATCTDISPGMLETLRRNAGRLKIEDRVTTKTCDAEQLPFEDGSFDLVFGHAVLHHLPDLGGAFREFARVLRPGGRISLWEPINRFGLDAKQGDRLWSFEVAPVRELAERVRAVFEEIQPPEDPMLDFDERDLVAMAEEAGFFPIRLELRIDVERTWPRDWDGFLHSSGNPNAPTFAEAMDEALSPAEAERFAGWLRPRVEQGSIDFRNATAYLWATKPG